MEENVIDYEQAERDEGCECGGGGGGGGLAVLRDVQRAYEERMQLIDRNGGSKKLEMQVKLLQSWVSDLVGQNTLLVRAVQELEGEVTSRLLLEKRRHAEMECEWRAERAALRRRLARARADARSLLLLLRCLRDSDCSSLDKIHFFDLTESDILGPELWRPTNMEQGDTNKHYMKQVAHKLGDE